MAKTTLIQANSLNIPLPNEFIHCIVTSPPYWGLRRYKGMFDLHWPETAYMPMTGLEPLTIPEWQGELGLEPTIEAYIGHMVLIFNEVWRILRKDGAVWLNLGDTYAGSGQGWQKAVSSSYTRKWLKEWGRSAPPGYISSSTKGQLKRKDTIGVPWRLAFALQARGWWLRSDIIWHKKNPMPESVRDRPARSHEYLFLLTKSAKYYYDHVAVREAAKYGRRNWPDARKMYEAGTKGEKVTGQVKGSSPNPTHNLPSVWRMPTEAYAGAHFATYPRKLVEPCIKAGTSAKGCCPACGAPWKRVTISPEGYLKVKEDMKGKTHQDPDSEAEEGKGAAWGCRKPRVSGQFETVGWEPTCECVEEEGSTEYNLERMASAPSKTKRLGIRTKKARGEKEHDLALTPIFETVGWEPTCECEADDEGFVVHDEGQVRRPAPVPCRVLDPFVGSGTTLVVARELGRDGVGLDLSFPYLRDQAKKRLNKPCQIALL